MQEQTWIFTVRPTVPSSPLASQSRYHEFCSIPCHLNNKKSHTTFSEALLMFVCFSSPLMTHGCWDQILVCRSSSQLQCAIPGHLPASRSMQSAHSLMPAWCMGAKTLWQRVLEIRPVGWVCWLWTRTLLMQGWSYCPLRTKQKVFVYSQTRVWISPVLKQVRYIHGVIFSWEQQWYFNGP